MFNSYIDRVRSQTAVDVLRRVDDSAAARLGVFATADLTRYKPLLQSLKIDPLDLQGPDGGQDNSL